ncbi:N-acetylmuramoyl-L-alanine amidase [Flavonifractor hominis]|uniref:N-acetylmuramoyl-L-alanine amidase n=1 Tax=Flavonifractor hominis TaxID=3133178 RepID=A0ABV1EPC9_9FIRM
MVQKSGGIVLLAIFVIGTICCLISTPQTIVPVFSSVRSRGNTLVIDAGHGGEDGGAVSHSGVPESSINLAISLKLDQLLGFYGEVPVLLRWDDRSLHDSSANTLHEKKVSDLHNRVELVNSIEQAVLLSIHQNTYPESKYHGAQVFYGKKEGSDSFASLTQTILCKTLDPSNTRQAKPIPESVYLMKHVTCTAILVECGFLSNPEEDLLLQTEDYQKKLASALAASWIQYLCSNGGGEAN